MTHSHDTSTPAMSAETVPSEEFVLVPLAECPIGLFQSADGELCLKTEYGNNEGRIDAYIVSSGEFFWGAAPQTIASQRAQMVRPVTLSASHFAKEGGGVGAAHPIQAFAQAILHGDDEHRGWLEEAAECFISGAPMPEPRGKGTKSSNASAPQPSPALAKGGDAVRERIARALNGVLGSEGDEHPRHHPAQNSSEKPTEVWWTQWLEAADAVLVALSTPTEGPASQTEGMGGEVKAKAKQALYSLRFEGQPMSSMFSAEELGLIVDTVSAALSTPTEGPASQDTAQDTLRRIEAMLDGDQGDDDGMQIMPDYPEGAGLAEKVAACIHLLERRRDIIEASVSPDAEADEEAYAEGCGYTGQHFGNAYDDAVCIDGYLWDLDSCDEPGGGLRSGGEIRCPKCNASPTAEGPAPQTEGMGGDALRDVRLDSEKAEEWPAAQKALWRVVTGENLNDGHYINAYRLTEKLYAAIAALTPPETAEAVPDDLTAAYMAGVERGREEAARLREDLEREIKASVSISETLIETRRLYRVEKLRADDAVKALEEARAATASDPAPATDDRERLVEASDKLVSIVEGIQGIEFGTFRAERNRVRLKDTKEWVEFYLALTRVHAALATEAGHG